MNCIDKNLFLLERQNIKEACNISTEKGLDNYLMVYCVYNHLLIQYFIKNFYLKDVDDVLFKHSEKFKAVSVENMDFYQKCSSGYLKYFYLRNNIYIERLNEDQLNFLLDLYNSEIFELTEENEKFIRDTMFLVLLEEVNSETIYNINYGPDNFKYFKPSNAIIIGVRYDGKVNSKDNIFHNYINNEKQLESLINLLERKVRNEKNIPFYVIEYNEFSVKTL